MHSCLDRAWVMFAGRWSAIWTVLPWQGVPRLSLSGLSGSEAGKGLPRRTQPPTRSSRAAPTTTTTLYCNPLEESRLPQTC